MNAAGFWERMFLGEFDDCPLNLGHEGADCALQSNVQSTTIVHEYGIFEMKVRYCVCVPKAQQLTVPKPIHV